MIDLDIVPAAIAPTFIDFGSYQRPYTGAEVTRIDRPGGKFRFDISLPPLVDGRAMVSRLVRAKQEGARIAIPLLGQSQGTPGAPLVNGAGQSGTTLNIDGLLAGYTAKEGYWLNIIQGGRYYLHQIATTAVADGSGVLAATIFPALRVSFSDNAVIVLDKPKIEGFIDGNEQAWAVSDDLHTGIQFTIEEYS